MAVCKLGGIFHTTVGSTANLVDVDLCIPANAWQSPTHLAQVNYSIGNTGMKGTQEA